MDVLRGFALLRILLINLSAFAMPTAAYRLRPSGWSISRSVNGVAVAPSDSRETAIPVEAGLNKTARV